MSHLILDNPHHGLQRLKRPKLVTQCRRRWRSRDDSFHLKTKTPKLYAILYQTSNFIILTHPKWFTNYDSNRPKIVSQAAIHGQPAVATVDVVPSLKSLQKHEKLYSNESPR